MAGTGTKILIFALILSFSFRLWADTKIAGIGSGSTTYAEAEQNIGTLGSWLQNIENLVKNNLATTGVSAIGIVFGNPYLAFAGIVLTLFNLLVFPQALLNEGNIGLIGTLVSNIVSLLYSLAILNWFGQRSDF